MQSSCEGKSEDFPEVTTDPNMVSRLFFALLVLSVVLEFSSRCEAQSGKYICMFMTCKREELENPQASLADDNPVPLNEYRRNKLMRLSKLLHEKRNLFDDVQSDER